MIKAATSVGRQAAAAGASSRPRGSLVDSSLKHTNIDLDDFELDEPPQLEVSCDPFCYQLSKFFAV